MQRSNASILSFHISACNWLPRAATHARAISGSRAFICIGDNFEQPLDTTAPNRRDDPELSEMGAD